MSAATARIPQGSLARMSVASRSLYPFVLAAMCETPPERRAATRVLDLPAGGGVLSFALRAAGFDVTPSDLFPEYLEQAKPEAIGKTAVDLFHAQTRATIPGWLSEAWLGHAAGRGTPANTDVTAVPSDMEAPLPFSDSAFDAVVCVEGIEHVMDRHRTLSNIRRVMKPGGRLVITTPNLLSIRSRLAAALAGQRTLRSYIDEYTSVWGFSPDRTRIYHGHAFLISYFQLRYSLHHCGFRIRRLWNSNWSKSSMLLCPLALPIAAATWYSQRPARKRFAKWRSAGAFPPETPEPYSEMFRHLLSPAMLFNATLIVDAEAI
jgi:2-polyprenyl-3-methyl-5-hydroxy-6-metoxy-1,4-benzoquinol methylase